MLLIVPCILASLRLVDCGQVRLNQLLALAIFCGQELRHDRVSPSADLEEVKAGYEILKSLGLRRRVSL